MSAPETVGRMLALIPWLLERPGASLDEAARAFGVGRDEILDDLGTIVFCGLPGLGGGDLFDVSIVGERVLVEFVPELDAPLALSPQEALRLLLAGEAVSAAMGDDLPALRSALDEVRRAVGIEPNVAVDLSDAGTTWITDVRRAIDGSRRVRIAYRGRSQDAPTTRTLDPWKLHVAEGAWYVQGFDDLRGEPRTFRLDRIASLEVLDERARPPASDLQPPRYSPGPEDIEIELVLPPAARWISESVLPDEIEDLEGGRRRVRFHTDAPRWVVGLVLSAPDVEVVAPPAFAEMVREEAAATLARYA